MYKKTVKFEQGISIHRINEIASLTRFEDLSPKEQRENYVLIHKQLFEIGKQEMPKKVRAELGQLQHKVCQKINEIRPKINGKPQTRDHFIDVARERLPIYLYKSIMADASERAKEGRKAKPVSLKEKVVSLVE